MSMLFFPWKNNWISIHETLHELHVESFCQGPGDHCDSSNVELSTLAAKLITHIATKSICHFSLRWLVDHKAQEPTCNTRSVVVVGHPGMKRETAWLDMISLLYIYVYLPAAERYKKSGSSGRACSDNCSDCTLGGLAHETSRRYLHQRKLQQKDVGLSPTVPPLRQSSPDWALIERRRWPWLVTAFHNVISILATLQRLSCQATHLPRSSSLVVWPPHLT